MINIFHNWYSNGWQIANQEIYRVAFKKFGGSVITHPDIITIISQMTDMPLTYMAYYHEDQLTGAIPLWGKYIAGHALALKKAGKREIVDFGNAEVILPLSSAHSFPLRFKTQFLSQLNHISIPSAKLSKYHLSLLKSYNSLKKPNFTKKFKYNRKREMQIFIKNGGYYLPVQNFSPQEFADIYIDLFSKRWNGKKPRGYKRLSEWLTAINRFQQGYILFNKDNRPIAVQLILCVESPQWMSVEYINGGLDPDYRTISIGSILLYLNTYNLSEKCNKNHKNIRFSFGKNDANYKNLWCYDSQLFHI